MITILFRIQVALNVEQDASYVHLQPLVPLVETHSLSRAILVLVV